MDYEPGSCNLDRSGRRKRLVVAVLGFGAALLAVDTAATGLSALAAFTMLLAIGFEGLYQYRFEFCPMLALAGVRADEGGLRSVDDPEDRAADRKMAWTVHLMSVGSAVFVAAALLLLRPMT